MKSMGNQSGLITFDFLFALTIVSAFSAVLFALTFTLSIVELVQYISFATARTYMSANLNEAAQIDLGKRKYAELTNSTAWSVIFKGSWFSLGDDNGNVIIATKANNGFNNDFPQDSSKDSATFYGARIPLKAPILGLKFPLIGSTDPEDKGFQTQISTYLMREPADDECLSFNANRLQLILGLDPRFSGHQGLMQNSSYFVMTDNGC